jgi:hypothetical protein
MTVEYILLLAMFVLITLGVFIKGPRDSFDKSGPLLAARVEKHLATGDGFTRADTGEGNRWGSE